MLLTIDIGNTFLQFVIAESPLVLGGESPLVLGGESPLVLGGESPLVPGLLGGKPAIFAGRGNLLFFRSS